MKNKYLFTSEFVSQGHPDKVADIISDSIVDLHISNDPNARVAAETFVAGNNIIIGGEIKSSLEVSVAEYEKLVQDTLISIGYFDNPNFTDEEVIKPQNIKVQVFLNKQSPDISQGVDNSTDEIGAGDQGIMFGYAIAETPNYMPATVEYSKMIKETVYQYAIKNPHKLGVDIKTQVTIDYETKENFENALPQKIETIVVSAPCVSSMNIDEVRALLKQLIIETNLPSELFDINDCKLYLNPTGRYVSHSPLHDTGLTGRKLIVDTMGGHSPIGGGAQSSKDYTKVDRSGLYGARYLAKHIVASGMAKKCSVQLSYAIGIPEPISINVDTQGTFCDPRLNDNVLSRFLETNFKMTPNWLKREFKLDQPREGGFTYIDTAKNGQVGNEGFPWEKLNRLEMFENFKNETLK
jgi:S-adenosylmethionine synthetase